MGKSKLLQHLLKSCKHPRTSENNTDYLVILKRPVNQSVSFVGSKIQHILPQYFLKTIMYDV